MRKTYILSSLLAIAIASATFIIWMNINSKKTEPIACSMEAKLCPDGSAVGRTGPNCEFAPCPDMVTSPPVAIMGDIILGVRQERRVGDLNITLNTIVQDSRCPIEVQCIWAGALKANVTLATISKSETRDMFLDEAPYLFDGHSISIVSGIPAHKSEKKISLDQYRITFHVATETSPNTKKDLGSTGAVSGLVTLAPICPVERMPPEPQCAPKPYQTNVRVFSSDSGKLIKSTQTGIDGNFSVTLPFGNYIIQAGGETVHPSCSPVDVRIQTATTSIDISCDTGIR